jgi:hypothetical protein
VEGSLSPLTILHRWEQAVSTGPSFAGSKLVAVECSLSPLMISLDWEQAGSKLLAVDRASLVGGKVASLGS